MPMAPTKTRKRPSVKRALARRRPTIDTTKIVKRFGIVKRRRTGSKIALADPPGTRDIRAMGPLVSIEFISNRGKPVTFKFKSPLPRLVYHRGTDRLWIVGGSYRVGKQGLVGLGSPSRARRVPMANALQRKPVRIQWDVFYDHHEHVAPREVLSVKMHTPKTLIDLGEIVAVSYKIDRGDADGNGVPWRHAFVPEAGVAVRGRHTRPRLKVSQTGAYLYITGGSYKIVNGWLAG